MAGFSNFTFSKSNCLKMVQPKTMAIMIKGNEYSFLGLIHLHFYKLLLLMLQI